MLMAFLDTNIFFNNWYLRSPNFSVLANYLGNSGATLLLSEVVRQEVEAKFNSEREKLLKNLAGELRRVADFQHQPMSVEPPALDGDFNFLKVVERRFENVEVIAVDVVSPRDLVPRAIKATRPFREGEKGFRDTLIWMSLLAYLKKFGQRNLKLLLVTANSNDFFEKSSEGAVLHSDLRKDLLELGLKVDIVPYTSVKGLIDQEVDLGLHSFSHEQFKEAHGDEMEHLAGDAAEAFLSALPLSELQVMLESAGVPAELVRPIRSFTVIDFEGTEDPEVTSFEKLKDETIYIGYTFNLLTVVFTVVVDANDYFAHQKEYDAYFINPSVSGSSVSLEVLRRCDFEGGLSYSHETSQFISVTIDNASLRHQGRYTW